MKPDASHIKKIIVVSNTHWDREFRRSFEKTRHRLLTMMDTTLDILENDPEYKSFTMDGHSIMLDDYLEIRPERRKQIEKFIANGRLIVGPYYTLPEEFSIGQEALVRNLMYGRKTVESYGGKCGTVAYTPSSWGQAGQLPQIFADFGLKYMMFYRGVSHHECDAEWIWEAPDGTQVTASRFALYCRYNWYYQVHRPVTTGRNFEKDYQWGEFDEAPMRPADGLAGEDLTFDLHDPADLYNPAPLKEAVERMVEEEGPHFTTSTFLAMHGHDISVAVPNESKVIKDAQELFKGTYEISHGTLEDFWAEAEKELDRSTMPVLKGERRSYLKEGKWTFLFPGTVSARTYLKQLDFAATEKLVCRAEPLAALSMACGSAAPSTYLDRGWRYLLASHTHDANGGCAPDEVCKDMEYRYRKVNDIADIVTEDAIAHITKNLDPAGQPADVMQLAVFNPLPIERDAIVAVDLEIPRKNQAAHASLGEGIATQPISHEASSSFVDSIWEVPRILESNRVKFHAKLTKLPALGYRVYPINPQQEELRLNDSLATGPDTLENEAIKAVVNGNGTVDLTCKATGKSYPQANYLRDQGETGNAWKHVPPTFDAVFNSLGCHARISIIESGPVSSTIRAEYDFEVPQDYADGNSRSCTLATIPVRMDYTLQAGSPLLQVKLTLDNTAKDHWLRACSATGLDTGISVSDAHFDVLERPIPLPDSRGWVERAYGMQPLQTFADVSDGTNGLAVLPKGLFEYEAIDDPQHTLALTLLRACRIKLAVSEEKMTELPDEGVQCPGVQTFEYALCPHAGNWQAADLATVSSIWNTPVRAMQIGRGKGSLPLEQSFIALKGKGIRISAIKPAEDANGIIVRLFNTSKEEQTATLQLGKETTCTRVGMDESEVEALGSFQTLELSVPAKKILSVKLLAD
ncbi:alpha-mannosidase [Pontiella sulfatireligans]|uniref:Mannosylglycerate hydrolase n=1 Tax=Pontiella sulfatireligans TaxID=2750658 RepID=A0A6C2UNT3_9BACT|nr:glycoside hydrolase family 38 C-terminal domain-containing protein [Pontiella sulfatireligans]VGO21922.1 Mannosylglycerate hydrolase [Pontiella sulfatireligans]